MFTEICEWLNEFELNVFFATILISMLVEKSVYITPDTSIQQSTRQCSQFSATKTVTKGSHSPGSTRVDSKLLSCLFSRINATEHPCTVKRVGTAHINSLSPHHKTEGTTRTHHGASHEANNTGVCHGPYNSGHAQLL